MAYVYRNQTQASECDGHGKTDRTFIEIHQ